MTDEWLRQKRKSVVSGARVRKMMNFKQFREFIDSKARTEFGEAFDEVNNETDGYLIKLDLVKDVSARVFEDESVTLAAVNLYYMKVVRPLVGEFFRLDSIYERLVIDTTAKVLLLVSGLDNPLVPGKNKIGAEGVSKWKKLLNDWKGFGSRIESQMRSARKKEDRASIFVMLQAVIFNTVLMMQTLDHASNKMKGSVPSDYEGLPYVVGEDSKKYFRPVFEYLSRVNQRIIRQMKDWIPREILKRIGENRENIWEEIGKKEEEKKKERKAPLPIKVEEDVKLLLESTPKMKKLEESVRKENIDLKFAKWLASEMGKRQAITGYYDSANRSIKTSTGLYKKLQNLDRISENSRVAIGEFEDVSLVKVGELRQTLAKLLDYIIKEQKTKFSSDILSTMGQYFIGLNEKEYGVQISIGTDEELMITEFETLVNLIEKEILETIKTIEPITAVKGRTEVDMSFLRDHMDGKVLNFLLSLWSVFFLSLYADNVKSLASDLKYNIDDFANLLVRMIRDIHKAFKSRVEEIEKIGTVYTKGFRQLSMFYDPNMYPDLAKRLNEKGGDVTAVFESIEAERKASEKKKRQSDIQRMLEVKNQEIARIEKEKESNEAELQKARSDLQKLSEALKKANEEKKQKLSELSEKEKQLKATGQKDELIKSLEERIEILEKDIEDKKNVIAQETQNVKKCLAEKQERINEREKLKKDLANVEAERNQLQINLKDFKDQVDQANQRLKDLQQKMSEPTEKEKDLEKEVTRLKQEIARLSKELEENEKAKAGEFETIDKEREESIKAGQRMAESLSNEIRKRNEKDEEIKKLKQEVIGLETKVSELEKNLSSRNEQLRKANENARKLRSKIKDLEEIEGEKLNVEEELKNVKKEKLRLEQKTSAQEEKIKKIEAELAEKRLTEKGPSVDFGSEFEESLFKDLPEEARELVDVMKGISAGTYRKDFASFIHLLSTIGMAYVSPIHKVEDLIDEGYDGDLAGVLVYPSAVMYYDWKYALDQFYETFAVFFRLIETSKIPMINEGTSFTVDALIKDTVDYIAIKKGTSTVLFEDLEDTETKSIIKEKIEDFRYEIDTARRSNIEEREMKVIMKTFRDKGNFNLGPSEIPPVSLGNLLLRSKFYESDLPGVKKTRVVSYRLPVGGYDFIGVIRDLKGMLKRTENKTLAHLEDIVKTFDGLKGIDINTKVISSQRWIDRVLSDRMVMGMATVGALSRASNQYLFIGPLDAKDFIPPVTLMFGEGRQPFNLMMLLRLFPMIHITTKTGEENDTLQSVAEKTNYQLNRLIIENAISGLNKKESIDKNWSESVRQSLYAAIGGFSDFDKKSAPSDVIINIDDVIMDAMKDQFEWLLREAKKEDNARRVIDFLRIVRESSESDFFRNAITELQRNITEKVFQEKMKESMSGDLLAKSGISLYSGAEERNGEHDFEAYAELFGAFEWSHWVQAPKKRVWKGTRASNDYERMWDVVMGSILRVFDGKSKVDTETTISLIDERLRPRGEELGDVIKELGKGTTSEWINRNFLKRVTITEKEEPPKPVSPPVPSPKKAPVPIPTPKKEFRKAEEVIERESALDKLFTGYKVSKLISVKKGVVEKGLKMSDVISDIETNYSSPIKTPGGTSVILKDSFAQELVESMSALAMQVVRYVKFWQFDDINVNLMFASLMRAVAMRYTTEDKISNFYWSEEDVHNLFAIDILYGDGKKRTWGTTKNADKSSLPQPGVNMDMVYIQYQKVPDPKEDEDIKDNKYTNFVDKTPGKNQEVYSVRGDRIKVSDRYPESRFSFRAGSAGVDPSYDKKVFNVIEPKGRSAVDSMISLKEFPDDLKDSVDNIEKGKERAYGKSIRLFYTIHQMIRATVNDSGSERTRNLSRDISNLYINWINGSKHLIEWYYDKVLDEEDKKAEDFYIPNCFENLIQYGIAVSSEVMNLIGERDPFIERLLVSSPDYFLRRYWELRKAKGILGFTWAHRTEKLEDAFVSCLRWSLMVMLLGYEFGHIDEGFSMNAEGKGLYGGGILDKPNESLREWIRREDEIQEYTIETLDKVVNFVSKLTTPEEIFQKVELNPYENFKKGDFIITRPSADSLDDLNEKARSTSERPVLYNTVLRRRVREINTAQMLRGPKSNYLSWGDSPNQIEEDKEDLHSVFNTDLSELESQFDGGIPSDIGFELDGIEVSDEGLDDEELNDLVEL